MPKEFKLVPVEYLYVSVLTACGNLEKLKQGKQIHARVITSGLCGNVVAESSLVDMYGKCGQVGASRRVFDRMRKRNTVSWCALLSDYYQNGMFESVIKLFRMMEGPDLYSFGILIHACPDLFRLAKTLSLWPALLGACTIRRDSAAVEHIALKMMELEPNNHLSYVHLINVYKSDGRWSDAMKIRELIEDKRGRKTAWQELG